MPSYKFLKLFAAAMILFQGIAKSQVSDPVVKATTPFNYGQQTTTVTVSEGTSGTTLYYTLDGTNPNASSSAITNNGSLLIPLNAPFKVQAYQGTTAQSNIIAAQYSVSGMVSAGTDHTLILKNNGTVFATGNNSAGQLGNGTTTPSTRPTQVLVSSGTPLAGIVAVAAGTQESFAVDSGGNLWAWGYNQDSELALAGSTNVTYATQVSSLSGIVSVASSQFHTLALRSDGAIYGFGANTYGQVGNGATSSFVTTPILVSAPSGQAGYVQNIVAIAAGANHSLAVDNNGIVWSWGANSSFQLGNGDNTGTAQSLPVQVSSITNAVGVQAGATTSYALLSTGSVQSWGNNSLGQLGAASQAKSSSTPVAVSGLVNIAALSNQGAIDTSGNWYAWGDNSMGELGVGYVGYYATLPLNVTLGAQSAPTLTASAGNGQTVNDGSFSSPFTITASSGGTPLANTWVNLLVNPSYGLLGLSSGSNQLSPIIGGRTNSNGQISFYLQAASNGSGSVQLTALSGATQSGLSAIEQAVQIASSGEPLPEWVMLVMAVALVYFATRPKTRPVA